jgi:MoaA/NifB/PqqE/SkfB family radical SAM enzyme
LHVEVTSACNQRCLYCTHPLLERAKRHMSVPLFRKIADQAAAHGTRMWLHFLGEPLLHPRIFDMVRHAKQAGVPEVGFSTNAVLLTAGKIAEAFESGLDRLEFSLDADDRAGYERMRGTDDFEVVNTNVRAFLAEKRRRAANKPVVTLGFLDAGHGDRDRERFVATWSPLLGERDFLMSIPAITFGGRGPARLADADRRPCEWLFRAALVLSNGDLVTCATDYEGERVLGNVESLSVAEIWRGDAYRELRDRHQRREFEGLGPCGPCRDWVHADGHGYVNFSREAPASAATITS